MSADPGGGGPRHVPVFYCPYCGEEDIRPHGGGHGQWLCSGCRRVWSVRFVGLAGTVRAADPDGGAAQAAAAAGQPGTAAPAGRAAAVADPGAAR